MARTPEQLAWDSFKNGSDAAKYDLHRLENGCGNGIPDVIGINYHGASFFLELKALKEWPKRATTLPLKNKFEARQIPFAQRWNLLGGHSFVLLRAIKEFYLLKPIHATNIKTPNEMTTAEIIDCSLAIGKKEIIKYLEDLKK
ncbi:DNA helicase [Aeromonas phage Gekk3-15]